MIKLTSILEEIINEGDPKTGTGKKPKGSGRRLYTDENPKDTVRIKFRTVQDIKDTLSKSSFKSKPHARQSQIINLIHQRVRAAYKNAKDPETKARLKKGLDYITKRKEASKKKTQRLKQQKENLDPKTFKDTNKAAPYGSGYKPLKENNDFDRINFYLEYYKNLSPSGFEINRIDDKIEISNIKENIDKFITNG